MGRPANNWEKAHHQGLKKGPWTPEEDLKLLNYIEAHGHGSWRALPAKAGLKRCGKSCRLRWTNYLRPDIKRGNFSFQEEQTIIQLHALLGNRWSVIANHLCKRTDNEIKNYWNTHLKKRLTKMGIDPVTHKPKAYSLAPAGQRKDAANLSHMAQWESARLEAEARLGRDSKLQAPNPFHTQLGFYPTAPPPCLDMLTAWQTGWLRSPTDSATASGIFSAAGNLESLTSTMNFAPRNPLPALVTGLSFAGNSSAQIEEAISMKEEADIGKSMDTIMALSRNDHAYVAESLKTVNENILQPDFLDGLSDLLFQNSDDFNSSNSKGDCENVGGSCSDDQLEENKNYWNSILSLLNCPPSGSPVF